MWKRGEVAALIARSFPVISQRLLNVRAAAVLPEATTQEKVHTRPSRLVVVVPKRVGTAPVRNRCKRRVRAIMRTPLQSTPYDIIVFVRHALTPLSHAELSATLEHIHVQLKNRTP
jgi:ribonuclease P protein component